MAAPGPDVRQKDGPHPHEALLDPTGNFLLVPDLTLTHAQTRLQHLEMDHATANGGARQVTRCPQTASVSTPSTSWATPSQAGPLLTAEVA